jgi:hypothetical protein
LPDNATFHLAAAGLAAVSQRSHLWIINLDLSEEEGSALTNELDTTVRNDRYPLAPRIQALEGDPREDQAGALPRTAAGTQALRVAASGQALAPDRAHRRSLATRSAFDDLRPAFVLAREAK